MSERWRDTYDQWKLATPPEHEGDDELDEWDQYEEAGPMDLEDQLDRLLEAR
jgi:hypothetical protein